MQLYIGIDFHPHQQTACWMDPETGELRYRDFRHNDRRNLEAFYASLPPSVAGIEAGSRNDWFRRMLFDNGHQLLVGDPRLIRARAESRHKNDRRDAELIRRLLAEDRFPALWQRPEESTEVLRLLSLRAAMVRQRTRVCNRLQAAARNLGLGKMGARTARFRELFEALPATAAQQFERRMLFALLEAHELAIAEAGRELERMAQGDGRVALLRTQQGVGLLTALGVVHALGDVRRFGTLRQAVAFAGLDPVDNSTGERVGRRRISKAGLPVLRHLLGQAAHLATRHDRKLKAFYNRLAKRKPKGVAKTATSRKLLVKLVVMLRRNITAGEFDARGAAAVERARVATGSARTAA